MNTTNDEACDIRPSCLYVVAAPCYDIFIMGPKGTQLTDSEKEEQQDSKAQHFCFRLIDCAQDVWHIRPRKLAESPIVNQRDLSPPAYSAEECLSPNHTSD